MSRSTVTAIDALPLRDLDHAHAAIGQHWEELRGQHVFVTGGTGFIGKWLLATLLDADARLGLGCRVTVLTRDAAAFRLNAPSLATAAPVRLLSGDVRDFVFDGDPIDRVIHAATDVADGASMLDTFDVCAGGTRRVLETAVRAGAREILIVGSGAVYGRQPPELTEVDESFVGGPDPLDARTGYAQGKRASEWLGAAFAAQHGLAVKVARCFALVGPHLPLDRHFAIGNFLRDAMAGQPITIQGDGTPMRSYLHASDMAAWLWAILLRGRSLRAYNVGGTEALSIESLARRVVRVLGSSSEIRVMKSAVAGVPAERYVPDVRRARSELSLPDPWNLDESILATAHWHRHRAGVTS